MEKHINSIYNIVEVIRKKGKLRVQAYDGKYVRFPKYLRVEGKVFVVDTLVDKGSYWVASGVIKEVN